MGNIVAPPRFLLFLAVLVAGFAVAAGFLPRAQAVMAAFDAAAAIFLLSCVPLFGREADDMRLAAQENDANRVMLLALSVILSMVILVTIVGEMIGRSPPSAPEKLLIAATLALAWTFANMVYALHYAHLYYMRDDQGGDRAGLDFPGGRTRPDYADFVYFSFTIGVALQTSDVQISSPAIRRVVTGHCVAAFVYNLGVLALAISVLGSA